LLLAAEPASFALQVDLVAAVPWTEWPMRRDDSPVRVALAQGDATLALQPGRDAAGAVGAFSLRKPLASPSQPFDVVATRVVGWAELPWLAWGAWLLASAAIVAALAAWDRQRQARRRAEDLLRLGQVARLNTLGELAGGLAHELNQPLTAMLANAQAARRLLDEDPPELDAARMAMGHAADQARRASEVLRGCAAPSSVRAARRRCSPWCCRTRYATPSTCSSRNSRARSRPACREPRRSRCRPSPWHWSRSSTTC
jgi:signal transduction histidine kinase